jgi:hypothetical protein
MDGRTPRSRGKSETMTTIDIVLDGLAGSDKGAAPSGIAWRRGDLRRQCFLGAWTALAIMGICAATAQERRAVATAAPMTFHIPAQPLVSALQAYGQQTGVQILYESRSATGQQSGALEGSFTPEEALKLLLAGTELEARYIRPNAITLALPPSALQDATLNSVAKADLSLGTLRVRASGEDDGSSLRDYNESVQADVQKALQKNAKTRTGTYRLVLDLWVDPSRTIERTRLYQSTGDPDRDVAVSAALRGVTLSKSAPANTPQPVRVAIVVRALQ